MNLLKSTYLLIISLVISISLSTQAQVLCENGFAGDYPCSEIDLMSFIPLSTFEAAAGNDSWGWTDPDTGREYAIFCNSHNTAFIDVSNPVNPVYLGKLDTHTSASTWRDVKVYNNYAFIVSEAGGHGMQVFDLTRLRNVANPPELFTEDAHNDSFGGAHNIAINEETGYAYIIGADAFDGGPIFVNLQDPLNPTNEGGYLDDGYSHDAQIIVYNGPDTEHVGKEIYLGANETSVVIVDVTDKENPVQLSEVHYSNTAYTHQLWIDGDHTFLYCNDEIDETTFGFNTRNIVFNLTDLDAPVLQFEYFGETGAIDHNNYVVGDKLYIANYTAGVRVIDVSDISNTNMNEVAYFDTHPNSDNASYNGAWSVYPYFASGNIVISDINEGFFLVKPTSTATSSHETSEFITKISPNPSAKSLTINSPQNTIHTIEVFNTMGQRVLNFEKLNSNEGKEIDISTLITGTYIIKINGINSQKFIKK